MTRLKYILTTSGCREQVSPWKLARRIAASVRVKKKWGVPYAAEIHLSHAESSRRSATASVSPFQPPEKAIPLVAGTLASFDRGKGVRIMVPVTFAPIIVKSADGRMNRGPTSPHAGATHHGNGRRPSVCSHRPIRVREAGRRHRRSLPGPDRPLSRTSRQRTARCCWRYRPCRRPVRHGLVSSSLPTGCLAIMAAVFEETLRRQSRSGRSPAWRTRLSRSGDPDLPWQVSGERSWPSLSAGAWLSPRRCIRSN